MKWPPEHLQSAEDVQYELERIYKLLKRVCNSDQSADDVLEDLLNADDYLSKMDPVAFTLNDKVGVLGSILTRRQARVLAASLLRAAGPEGNP